MTMHEPESQRDVAGQWDRQPDLASGDPYAVLGLTRRASEREIKRAYFGLVREYSPETDPEAFKLIRAAYEKLRKTEVREETDLFLFQLPYPWEPRGRRGAIDLEVHPEDIRALLRNHGDLGRDEFLDDYRPVRL